MSMLPDARTGLPRLGRRPAGDGFVEVTGERIALFGAERGPLELWMWPLKVASDLRLSLSPGAAPPAAVTVTPGGLELLLEEVDARVRVRACACRERAGLVLVATLEAGAQARLVLEFRCDFRPQWPAGLGGQVSGVDAATDTFYLAEELGRFAFVVGAPGARRSVPATDHGLPHEPVRFELDLVPGVEAPLVLAGATVEPPPLTEDDRRGAGQAATGIARARHALGPALELHAELLCEYHDEERASDDHWREFLGRTTTIETPDAVLDQAFEWSKVALERARVAVDGVGRGLVAGIGPSGHGERPGYAWFFDGDALCAARAQVAVGDESGSRAALRFAASNQRADGKLMHELTLSARLCDWLGDYPYAYYKGLNTPDFVSCLAHHVAHSGDLELARELWPAVLRALAWCESCLDAEGRMSNRRAGIAAVEAGPLSDRIQSEIFLHGAWVAAARGAAWLARRLGEAPARFDALFVGALRALWSFWSEEHGRHGFATLDDGRLDDLSVYVARPFAEGEGTPARAHATLLSMNAPELVADWGGRMFATDSAAYDPRSYNTGAVFPYLTNFLTLAQYRHGHAEPAWQLLASQARLVHLGGLGLLEEHLEGETLTIPTRGVAHQVFSSSAILESTLLGLFGLEADAPRGALTLRPTLPPDWRRASVRRLRIGATSLDLELRQSPASLDVTVRRQGPPLRVAWAPILPPLSLVEGAAVHRVASGALSLEPVPVESHAELRVQRGPSLLFPGTLGERDAPSAAPRLVGREVGARSVRWTLAGRAGTTARLGFHCERPCSLAGQTATVTFPHGSGWTRATLEVEVE